MSSSVDYDKTSANESITMDLSKKTALMKSKTTSSGWSKRAKPRPEANRKRIPGQAGPMIELKYRISELKQLLNEIRPRGFIKQVDGLDRDGAIIEI